MKKSAKTTLLVVLIVLILSAIIAGAITIFGSKPYSMNEENVVRPTITIYGEKHNLYKEFADPQSEIDRVNESKLGKKVARLNLGRELNESNWEDFETALYFYSGAHNIEESDEYIDLQGFFDIYENTEQNEEIIKFVEENNLEDASAKSNVSAWQQLYYMLPNDDPLCEAENQRRVESPTQSNW